MVKLLAPCCLTTHSRRTFESVTAMVNLGDEFPDFKVDTSEGEIQFHEYIKDS